MEIRKLGKDNLDIILDLEGICFPNDRWRLEDWEDLLTDDRATYYGLMDEDKLVGNVFTYNWKGENDYMKIMNLSVHPDYRGKGLAHDLMTLVQEEMEESSLKKYVLRLVHLTKPCKKYSWILTTSFLQWKRIVMRIQRKMVSNMYMKTKVYLVRHAQPNLDNHDDFSRELSPKGLEDRKRVTEFLSDKNIDVVYSSPFKRAVDTIADFADSKNKKINIVDEFRERKVGDYWLDDFTAFTQNQWKDFNYKLPDGECLKEVQERNISALKEILERHPGEKIVIGSHGTAMSTIINYYDSSFGYEDFEKIKGVMPWLVEIVFDENKTPVSINKFNII